MVIRVVFVIMTVVAIAGASYGGYYGRGGASSDLDRSVRSGSPGAGALSGRIK